MSISPKVRRNTTPLGGRLTDSRLGKRWTQHQLARAVPTSQAVIQRIETGRCLHPRIIAELATAVGVNPAWLMYGVEPIEDLRADAVELARAWSRLLEPDRAATREMILNSSIDAA